MQTVKVAALLLVLLAWMPGAAPALAETVNCTAITVLPAVITAPGVYCFTGNLATAIAANQGAIEIQTNDVVLDLNGFKLEGLAGPFTFAFGIHAADRQNITIKNGTIRGFRQAIVLDEFASGASKGHLVEDIRAERNYEVGMQVKGSGNVVRNNQVVATGGTTVFGPDVDAVGLRIQGNGSRVLNNDVTDTVAQGTGTARGILFVGSAGGLAVNNRISVADEGISYGFGATGKYRDNLTSDVTAPFVGSGTDAGNNS
jgi:hypothetical protein